MREKYESLSVTVLRELAKARGLKTRRPKEGKMPRRSRKSPRKSRSKEGKKGRRESLIRAGRTEVPSRIRKNWTAGLQQTEFWK